MVQGLRLVMGYPITPLYVTNPAKVSFITHIGATLRFIKRALGVGGAQGDGFCLGGYWRALNITKIMGLDSFF